MPLHSYQNDSRQTFWYDCWEARQAASPIAAAFFKSASAILMLAMSISRPSSDTAPFPALAASAIALTMRRALGTSASAGENTPLAGSTCGGWHGHLPA